MHSECQDHQNLGSATPARSHQLHLDPHRREGSAASCCGPLGFPTARPSATSPVSADRPLSGVEGRSFGSILVPRQADRRRRGLRLLMAVASGFQGLRRVAYCRRASEVAYESVALPLSYPGVSGTYEPRLRVYHFICPTSALALGLGDLGLEVAGAQVSVALGHGQAAWALRSHLRLMLSWPPASRGGPSRAGSHRCWRRSPRTLRPRAA